jgi:hypothetical protein
MKKITVFFFLLLNLALYAQVGVNTTTPDPSSMLDIASINKGVLVPRVSLANVTTTMLDGTNTAATGLLIWNTNAATVGGNGVGFYFFNGTQWIPITQTITGNTLDQSYDQGGAGIGKNINATDGAVRINGDDGFLVTGIFGTGNIINTEITGAGTRMFFNPRKAAFRAGSVFGNEWDDSNIGDFSIALGRGTIASNTYDIAIGFGSTASGSYSTTLGWANTASGAYSFSMGQNSTASGFQSTVLGYLSNATEDNSMVFGNNSIASGDNSFALGNYTTASGINSMAFGNNLTSESGYESVFGTFNTDYTPININGFNNADRLFVIGNGTNATNLSNALTIFKDGRMNINDAYTMPTSDGTNGQVMQTNGSGTVSWATPSTATDDQQIDVLSLTGDTLNISLQDDGIATQTVDLSPLRDHDWYEVGTTVAPNAITDNIFHNGNVVIGKNTLDISNPKLDIENNNSSTSLKIRDVSTGITLHTGIDLTMQSTATSSEYGLRISHNNPNSGLKYGVFTSVENGNGTNSAFQGRIEGSGLNIGSSIIIFDSGSINTSEQMGNTIRFEQASNNNFYGLLNEFSSNNLVNDSGTKYGIRNNFGSTIGGTIYGLYNSFQPTMSNNFDKYGSFTSIPATLGGTHYGIYSSATKTGSYAGYFLGNVSIGTTISNSYILPSSRGANGQIMQIDGTGNVTWVTPATGTDDQNLTTPTLVGTTLNLNIENGTGTSIDLAPLQDGTGTDNQTLALAGNNLSISGGNTVNLSALNTDDQNLVTPTLVGTTLNLNIENGIGTSIDLAPLQDGTGTDNQTLALAGNNLSISGGNTVNLSALNTDDQNLVTPTLVGTTLNLNIENGTGTSIDLAPLQDGTGTDDQTIDNFSLSGTTLRLSLENDGQPLQTVNLASLVGTDDQNLVTPTLVGTTLNLNIENGIGTSIDLAPLQDGTGTDDQTIDNFSLSGTTLRLSLENDGQPLQTVNLAPLLDHDWYEVGGTNPANSILDNIYTGGDVSIGKTTAANGKVDIDANDKILTLFLENNNTSNGIKNGIFNSLTTNPNNSLSSGILNNIRGNATFKTGVTNNFATNNSGPNIVETGISNQFYSSGNVSAVGYSNFFNPISTNSGNIIGFQNSVSNGITGFFIGFQNTNDINSNDTKTGLLNNFEGGGSGAVVGIKNELLSTTTGEQIGIETNISSTGTGIKYGEKIEIDNASGGLHYGIYSDVTKANSFAGYFLGRLSIGTTTTNNYILPSSRGTNGQIMQTDGVGNVSWVNSPTTESTTANNGLTQIADNIQLGGTLIQNTSVTQGVNSLDINLNSTGDFSIQDNGTDVFFVEHTGDIGIGTSNPAFPLHIVENVAATTQGVYIDKTDNTTVETSGLYIQKTGTGTGRSHAIYTNVDGTGTGQKYGIFNTISSNAIGNQYGTRNYINSATSSFIFGTFNNLDNAGTGNQYGVYNGMRGTSAANLYGTYNEFNSPSITNETAGVYNSFTDGTPGTSGIMGVYSEFSNPSNGTYYGVRNAYTAAATGTGIKYGTYNLIPAAAGGTHYGTFNSVDVSNGWAGYFVGRSYFSDRLSVGETNNANAAISINKNSTGTYSHLELKESVADDGARIRFTNAAELTNEWVLFGRADNTNSDSSFNIFNNVSGNVVVVNGDGRVGIMRAPATNALEVNGNASKNVAGAFIANSDSRLKKDITTISPNEALDKILKLRGVTYYWNDDKTGTTRPENLQMGFIAQEIAEVFPEKVSEDNLGYLQTAYGDYDPIVFQAIKALNDKIENLEKENAALKSIVEKVNALEAKLEQMNIK